MTANVLSAFRFRISRHNGGVLTTVRILVCLLVVLAGCTTAPRDPPRRHPLDWPPLATTPLPAPSPSEPPPVERPTAPVLPAPAPAAASEATWSSLTRWAAERGLAPPRCQAVSPVATYSLLAPGGILLLQIGSHSAWWDGVEFRLGFTPQLIAGDVWLRTLDLRKNIEPLLRGFTPPPEGRRRTIVLDPGHGGASPGARSTHNGAWEKDYTLDCAFRLGQRLAARGWQVFLTRTNDTDVPLTDRVAFAEQHGADLFVSLHFNSAGGNGNGGEQEGLETYCLTPAGMPSTLTRGYADDPGLELPGNAFDEGNIQFAVQLHRAILRATGQTDRGVRRARFMTVLQGQRCPAVLVEGGYLSNPKEAQRVADWQFRQRLAEAIADVLK